MSQVSDTVENYALFVGSLSAATNSEMLVQYFSRFGEIQGANLITDWATGASKRCAIVFCADELTCKRALASKYHKLDGKTIRVSLADQEKKGTKKISTTNLFVGNISEKCTELEIRMMFDKFGPIESVRFFKNASTKPKTKNAIIQYIDSKSVELAFKSKSEMGTDDDSLKISPLKQKKANIPSASKQEGIDDLTAMMMIMNAYQQGFEIQGETPEPNLRFSRNPEAFPDFQINEHFTNGIPQQRSHRKSSSVDILPTAKSPHPDFSQQLQHVGVLSTSLHNQKLLQPQVAQMKKKEHPLQAPRKPALLTREEDRDTKGSVAAAEDVGREGYGFVTLIDLFDDEDNLSTSFFGVPANRLSVQGKSVSNFSQRQLGDSGSELAEEVCE